MAIKQINEASGELENKTGTELDILKRLEKAYYEKNPEKLKRNTDQSLKWFKDYITKNWQHVRTSQLMRDRSLLRNKIEIGKVYFAYYDPIHKATLPVYDRFPMLMPFDAWTNDKGSYILSINLHYLTPALRLVAMQEVLRLRNETRYRKSTRLKMTWDLLKGLSNHRLYKHCIKMYRVDHFETLFIEIPSQSWEMVCWLPTQRFMKGGKSVAWKIK